MTPRARAGSPADAIPVVLAVVMLVGGLVVVAFAPLHVVLGVGRLAVWILAAAGAWLVIGRTGAVDLSVGAALGAGAGAAVLLAESGAAAWSILPVAPIAGAVVGGVSGAMTGRLGRRFAALATLALGLGALAVGAALLPGGAAGFHAVPLLTSDRQDTAIAVLATGVGLFVARRLGATTTAASAAVGARRPDVLEAMGPHPVAVSAIVGAWAGAMLGLAGGLQAILSGSVVPGAFGLQTTAGLALAAVLGGAAPLGPLLGAGLVWGPGIAFPLVPGIGTAPPLLVAGAVGLVLLTVRRGRPLSSAPPPRSWRDEAPRTVGDPAHLTVGSDAGAAFEVRGGEVVAVIGPNGIGKSTLLARIGGQLPDHGAVDLDGTTLPVGARRRAALGIARTWQRPPDVPGDDLMQASGVVPRSVPVEQAQLEALALRPPRVALLDEPTTDHESVARLVRRLAQAGTAVVLVDHREPVQGLADRVIHLGSERPAPLAVDASDLPPGSRSARRRGSAARPLEVVVSDAAVADDVSVFDHLAAIVGPRRADEFLAAAPLLAGRGEDPAGVLSGGERRVLALLAAFARQPEVLVLEGADEGLDPASLAWARSALRAFRAEGATVVVRSSRGDDVQWADISPD